MDFYKMQTQINAHLTTQTETDIVYLLSTMKTCKNIPDSDIILDYCTQLLETLTPEMRKRHRNKLISTCLIDYETTLSTIQQAIAQKDTKEAEKLLKPLLKQATKIDYFQNTDTISYYSFQNPYEKQLYIQHYNPKNILLVTPIPYSSLYFQLGELHILNEDYDEALTAFNQALQHNPVDELIHSRIVYVLSKQNELTNFMDQATTAYTFAYTKEALARCFYHIGWYCSTKRYYDEAKVFLTVSLSYNDTNVAERALKKLADKLDEPITTLSKDQQTKATSYLQKYNLDFSPSLLVLDTYQTLINDALDHNQHDLAKQYETLLSILLFEQEPTQQVEIPFVDILKEEEKPKEEIPTNKLQEILILIESGLTNNTVHDMSYLLEQASLYKNSPYNIPVYLQIKDWLLPLLNQANKRSYLRLLDDASFDYNTILKQIQTLITNKQYEQAETILTKLIQRLEDDNLYQEEETILYFSFQNTFEGYLYKTLLPTTKTITPTLIPYSTIYALLGDVLLKQHSFHKALAQYETALKWNPVDANLFNTYTRLQAKLQNPKKAFTFAQQGYFIAYTPKDLSESFANIALLLHLEHKVDHAKIFALRSLAHYDNNAALTLLKTIAKQTKQPYDSFTKQQILDTITYAKTKDLNLTPSTFILDTLNTYLQTLDSQNTSEQNHIKSLIQNLNNPIHNETLPILKEPPLPIKETKQEETLQCILTKIGTTITGDISKDEPFLEEIKQTYQTHPNYQEILAFINHVLQTVKDEDNNQTTYIQNSIKDATYLIEQNDLTPAKATLDALLETLQPQLNTLNETLGTTYYSFENDIEHQIFDEQTQAIQPTFTTNIPLSTIYYLYAKIEHPKENLEKALTYNPVSTKILFAYLDHSPNYLQTLIQLYHVSYTKEDFAKTLLLFGLYFKTQQNNTYARLFLDTSNTFEPSLLALNALKELPEELLTPNDILTIRTTLKQQGFDISASKEVVASLIHLAKDEQTKGHNEQAKTYYTLLYTLIQDETIKQLIDSL